MIRKLAEVAADLLWGAFAFLVAAVILYWLGTGIGARVLAIAVAVVLVVAPEGLPYPLAARLFRKGTPDA